MQERIHPNVIVRHPSPNHYAGRGTYPTLIVIHDTESPNEKGKSDLEAIGNTFGVPHGNSAHVCTDGEGNSARYVRDEDAAWECVEYNRVALGIEQIGYASQTRWSDAELHETARWVAHWSRVHGIPIRKAITVSGHVVRSGVTTHSKLGVAGGGHHDPGTSYPMKRMMDYAKHYRKMLQRA